MDCGKYALLIGAKPLPAASARGDFYSGGRIFADLAAKKRINISIEETSCVGWPPENLIKTAPSETPVYTYKPACW
jgi:hypothetical protein